jgi:hypothetical protein
MTVESGVERQVSDDGVNASMEITMGTPCDRYWCRLDFAREYWESALAIYIIDTS